MAKAKLSMKVGDIVIFPSEMDGYAIKNGLLLGFRDNPSDVRQIKNREKYGTSVSGYCERGPRKIADILYRGRVVTCWKHNVYLPSSSEEINETR